MKINLTPTVKQVQDFYHESFAFAEIDNLVGLATANEVIVSPKHGRYGQVLASIFENATDVIGAGVLTKATPVPTRAVLWDTEVLRELSPSISVPERIVTKESDGAESVAAAEAMINYRIYRSAQKVLKPDVLHKYHSITAPAAKVTLDAAKPVDKDMVEDKLKFAHVPGQVVALMTNDKDRYLAFEDAAYDEAQAAAKFLATDAKKASAIVTGADMGLTAAQITSKFKISNKDAGELLFKWKEAHPALLNWQPRHFENALKVYVDIKGKILIDVTNRVASLSLPDAPKAQFTWNGDALIYRAHSSQRDAVSVAVHDALSQRWPELGGMPLTLEKHGQTVEGSAGEAGK